MKRSSMLALGSAVLLAVPACLVPAAAAQQAARPIVIDLWPGKPPGDIGIDGAEKTFQLQVKGKPYEVGGKPTNWVTNVSKPQIVVYPAPKDRNTGIAMLICPGGGYHNLGWDVEGEEVAAWLNSAGMTGIILKYRCPRRPGDAKGVPPPGPLKDAQRAVSLVRSRAKEWGVDGRKIGMVGFSAGGHLSAATALNHDRRAYDAIDDIDRVSCRPDFAIPLYSGYLVGNDNDTLSADMRVSKDAPPILLIHAGNDSISKAENSIVLYTALKKAGATAELHVYGSGGHGFGVRKVGHPCDAWTDRCLDWLKDIGIR